MEVLGSPKVWVFARGMGAITIGPPSHKAILKLCSLPLQKGSVPVARRHKMFFVHVGSRLALFDGWSWSTTCGVGML